MIARIKSILTMLTIFFLWLAMVIIMVYLSTYLLWFIAIPLVIGLICLITYITIYIVEKVI